jgi:GAF domain-containing protein/DNA-binding response OmpR family regulator
MKDQTRTQPGEELTALQYENETLRQRLAELQAREAEHQRTEQVQMTLYRIADAASAAEDMQGFYAAMHQIVGELMAARNFYIALYDYDRQMINFPYYVDEIEVDIPPPNLWEKVGLGDASGTTAYLLRTGQPLLLSRAEQDELVRAGEIEDVGMPSAYWLGVPLKTDEGIIGVLAVQSYTEAVTYTDQDLTLLNFVGQHIATALERVGLQDETRRLLAETEARNAELSIINSVQRGLAAKLDIQAIYDLVGDQIRDVFDAQGVIISYYERSTNHIHSPYYLFQGERINQPALELGQGLTSHIIESGQPLLINEHAVERFKEFGAIFAPGESEDTAKSWLGVPLITGEQVTGVIILENYEREGAYRDWDVRLLSTLAASMGVALESARLFDETQRLLKETEERNSELAIINSISKGLVKQLDFQAIIDLVGDKIRDIFEAQIVTISLYNPLTRLIHHRYAIELDQRFFFDEAQAVDPDRLEIIQTRQPLLFGTSLEMIEHSGEGVLRGEMPQSYLGVPIVLGSEVTGVVTVQDLDRQHLFGNSDVRLLSTLAASMGVALENARLFEVEQAQARRQAALFRLSAALAAATDEAEICRQLVAGLQDEALGYAYVGVFLLDPATGERVQQASTGLSEAEASLRLAPGQGLSERALLDGQLHYTPDATQTPGYVPALGSGSEVDVPLKIGREVVGVLTVESRQPNAFDQRDFDTLTSASAQAGVALGQARSLAQARQRAAELATVNSIGQAISAQLDLEALIELVGEQVRQTFNADIVYLALHDRQTDMIHFRYTYGEEMTTIRFGEGLTSRIIESGQPLLINEDIVGRHTELKTEQIGVAAQSYLGVPIFIGQQAIGVISVQSTSQEGRFDDTDLSLLNTIAANVGAAMQNAQLYQETQRRAEEMAALAEVSREVSATLDLDKVLEQITTYAGNLLQADSSAVYLLDAGSQVLRATVALGAVAEESKADVIPMGEGIIGGLAQQGRAEFINDTKADPRTLQIPGTSIVPDEKLMVAPLLSGERVSGMMAVWRSGPGHLFTPDDLRFLEGLARQAAIAIENARLFEEAQEAQATANAANEAKSAFLASVSHELRTPLTSVLGFAKLSKQSLEKKLFPKIQADDRRTQRDIRLVSENMDIIISEGERLTTLINNVLDLAKIEAGKVDWDMQPLVITEVVERATAATASLFEPKGLWLVKDFARALPEIVGDQDKLMQVVINLISNAVKFTAEGSITCRAEAAGNEIIVSVIDTGLGIAPDDQPKVFEKFKQVGDTLTDKPQGTGLGLPICKEIIEHHGGRIWVESEVGQGSTFSFALPVQWTEIEAEITTQPMELTTLVKQLKQHVVTTVPNGADRPKTILVVDDEEPIRKLLKHELGEAGYQIKEAANGQEALLQIRRNKPDLVILDVLMPTMNGFNVAAILKNDPQTIDLPIIMLTIVEDAERSYRLGVDRYLTKPIDTEALFTDVEGLLTRSAAPRQVLIVDDEAATVQTLAEVLQKKGQGVVKAYTADDFVEKAVSANPDIILVNAKFSDRGNDARIARFEQGLGNVVMLFYQ